MARGCNSGNALTKKKKQQEKEQYTMNTSRTNVTGICEIEGINQ